LIGDQERSGLGVSAFCRDRGVSTASFYTWRKRLGQADGVEAGTEHPVGFLEVKLATAAEQIVPLPAARAAIEVRLGKGRSLIVAAGFDALHLQRLLAVLEGAVSTDRFSSGKWEAGS
jgi:transposase-like protein